jgi:hypothetical protein
MCRHFGLVHQGAAAADRGEERRFVHSWGKACGRRIRGLLTSSATIRCRPSARFGKAPGRRSRVGPGCHRQPAGRPPDGPRPMVGRRPTLPSSRAARARQRAGSSRVRRGPGVRRPIGFGPEDVPQKQFWGFLVVNNAPEDALQRPETCPQPVDNRWTTHPQPGDELWTSGVFWCMTE